VITLAAADLVVLAVFAATLFGLGFSAKLRELSVFQFVTAGRQLTLPWFVATLVTTWYGGVLGIGESVSYYGIGTWLLLGVPYYIFAGIYAARMAGQVREADQFSIPERVAHRWGKGAGLVSGSLVFLLAVPAAHVLMLATLVQGLTGWGLPVAIPVAVLCGTAFLYKGGLLADVHGDDQGAGVFDQARDGGRDPHGEGNTHDGGAATAATTYAGLGRDAEDDR
jgi:SSS family solute:Na+ symporter